MSKEWTRFYWDGGEGTILTWWHNSHMRAVNKIFKARKECCCNGCILVPRGHTMAAGCHSAVQYSTAFFSAPHLSAKITKCRGESLDGSCQFFFFFLSGPKFKLIMYRQENRDTGSRLIDLNGKLLFSDTTVSEQPVQTKLDSQVSLLYRPLWVHHRTAKCCAFSSFCRNSAGPSCVFLRTRKPAFVSRKRCTHI